MLCKVSYFLTFQEQLPCDDWDDPIDNGDNSGDDTTPDPNQRVCGEWETIDIGNNMYVLNNMWGKGDATQDSYQCVTANTVEYKWVSAQSYNSVKAYPAIIMGWHWGYHFGEGAGGLPQRLYSRPSLMTSWSISHEKWETFE